MYVRGCLHRARRVPWINKPLDEGVQEANCGREIEIVARNPVHQEEESRCTKSPGRRPDNARICLGPMIPRFWSQDR